MIVKMILFWWLYFIPVEVPQCSYCNLLGSRCLCTCPSFDVIQKFKLNVRNISLKGDTRYILQISQGYWVFCRKKHEPIHTICSNDIFDVSMLNHQEKFIFHTLWIEYQNVVCSKKIKSRRWFGSGKTLSCLWSYLNLRQEVPQSYFNFN